MYFRNKIDVISHQGDDIDATSLWHGKTGGELTLVDDDLYATITHDDTNFEEAC
jgi:hypothetical protein